MTDKDQKIIDLWNKIRAKEVPFNDSPAHIDRQVWYHLGYLWSTLTDYTRYDAFK